jgi:hypothetical protein
MAVKAHESPFSPSYRVTRRESDARGLPPPDLFWRLDVVRQFAGDGRASAMQDLQESDHSPVSCLDARWSLFVVPGALRPSNFPLVAAPPVVR